ncbi:MAG: TonB-dependent receptor [Pyrinomonadaceae bacterium MAG19_C2-C3]|nr:TonB-dependent receptor [Pyrinomonadaceae bacterium MAG19_C2-C3]
MKRFIFAVLMLCAFVASASAQTTSGRLVGTVSGPDGVIPGATVTVTDNQTKREQTLQTSGQGAFSIPLEFGTYTVNITAQGFKTSVTTDIKIDVNREYTLNPTLEVGQVSEEVTVVGGADILNASNGELSTSVSPVQIQALPLDGRSPLSLTTLQSGTQSTGGVTTINGQRTSFTNITRDGINVQDNFIRANATDFSPERSSSDDTGEFTIVTQNAGAESGYGAAQIQLVTPRGQSTFDGALYIYNRNSRFSANDFVGNSVGRDPVTGEEISPRPFLNRNQFGGRVSGPLPLPRFGEGGRSIIRDKAFFFFNYEKQFLRQAFPFSRTVLTESARNGLFTFIDSAGATRQVNIFSLLNGAGGAPTSINPLVRDEFITGVPLGNTGGGDGLNTTGFSFNQSFPSDYDYYTTRIDVDINDRNTVNGVYTDKREILLRPDAQSGGFNPTSGIQQPGTNRFLALAYRYSSAGGFSNEVRGGFSFPEAIFDQTGPNPGFFVFSPIISGNTDRFVDQGRTQRNYNIQDNASFIAGNHTVRFGFLGQFFRVNPFNAVGTTPTLNLGVNQNTPQLTAASFGLPTGTTISATNVARANNLLATLGGIVGSAAVSFNQANITSPFGVQPTMQDFKYENYAGYIADQWRVTPRLSLNYGLRYDVFTALRLENGLFLEPAINGADPVEAILNPNGRFQFLGGNAGSDRGAFHNTDKNNFSPVVSFAYSPEFKNNFLNSLLPGENRTAIRGGFRISYVQDQVLTTLNNAGVGNVGLGRTIVNAVNASNSTQLNLRAGDPLPTFNAPTALTPETTPTFLANNGPNRNNFGTVFGVDPDLQTTSIMEYNFGIQREIGFQTAIEIKYVGNRSGSLLRAIDYNQVDIFNNGLLEDFNRARANLLASGSPFTGTPLTIFGIAANSRIRIGTGANAVSSATFINNLNNGTPADLAGGILSTNADFNTANGQFPILRNPNTGVADLVQSDGGFNYNSLQAEIRRRFAQGVSLQANYTFSKTLTDTIGTSQQLFDPLLDLNNPGLEYTRSDLDQTHAFNFNTVAELPFGRGKRFFGDAGGALDRLIGGFQFTTILRYGTGRPVTIVDARGTLNRAVRSGRQTPDSPLSRNEIQNLFGDFELNGQRYFINPSVLSITQNADGSFTSLATNGPGQDPFAGQVFFNVAPGTTGSVNRAIVNGPKLFTTDMGLLKNIRLSEGTRLVLRAEAFNVFNHANFRLPLTVDINSSTFGQLFPTDTSPSYEARRLQFAVRFEF